MHIIVEGISCSGKTTFIKNNYSSLNIVPELTKLEERLPEFSLDQERIIASNRLLIDLDLKRFNMQKEPSVFDRWLFSTFAYAYARHNIYGIEDGDQLRDLTNDIRVDFSLKIMDTPFEICMDRLAQREQTDFLAYQACTKTPYTKEFHRNLYNYYAKIKNIKSVNLPDYILH